MPYFPAADFTRSYPIGAFEGRFTWEAWIVRMDILCVDDDTNDVLLLERSLKKAGFGCQVYNARSLQEAEDYLAGEGKFLDRDRYPLPDIILTDLAFRGGSGLDFLRWFRSRPELARIPVLCVTGSEDPEKREEARKFGAPCVTKTADFSEVAGRLGTMLSGV